jgi:transcriptional regulator with XRE-family HTH domain
MQKINVTVGSNIKKFRQLKGYSQEALALESGLSQGYINQLENGKRKYTQKSIERIARALSMSVVDFFHVDDADLLGRKKNRPQSIKKSSYRKELSMLLKGLPDYIIEHYLTLLKIEKDIWKEKNKPLS